MTVSIVIIAYNGKKFLEKCLLSLKSCTDSFIEIIVVDDASVDGTLEMVKQKFPKIKVVRHKENKGPATARNTGAKLATGDIILFSDCDIIFQENTIPGLLKMLRNEKMAVAGSRIIPKGKDNMDWNFGHDCNIIREMPGYFFGLFIKANIFPNFFRKVAGFFILHYIGFEEERKVDWVVEGCFAVKRNIFEQVGGFDQDFFMFFEGPDLCRRIRDIGYEVWYSPDSIIRLLPHHTHSKNRKRTFLFLKSYIIYCKKHSFFGRVFFRTKQYGDLHTKE